ncbi:hypothetical protein BST81_08545 [Leptolyngbya sp. 'hensonii']|uniref:class I SAM-dependent methyltransferase n=1 Tax=Leptolyngbya sp. 'hensonii' TaxID=1922337 RepID=UPI00094F5D90|nr:class I SAM-dependent methyltransferase [Leptolyngbya sp. 'hensonii']OLP18779.1 hypothetical protein BST81_08545 [Leptolyngbya sp. 'hensonii']
MGYSERLLEKGNSLTRTAHRSRYKTVLDLIQGHPTAIPYTLALDYGCGDAWLLRIALEQNLIRTGIGVDVDPQMVATCNAQFANQTDLQVCHPDDLPSRIAPHSCDLLLCTETLEHVHSVPAILADLLHYAQPQARLVISVPIEIGPSLLVKQMGRFLANWKGDYGYESYTPDELFAAGMLWDTDRFPSSHSSDATYKGHKGFDYRKVERLLRQTLQVEQQIFTPFPIAGNLFNSTVVWLCRPPAAMAMSI